MQKWTAGVVGKMHLHGITQSDLASKMGIRRDYLNKILHGKENPSGARTRIITALNTIIEERSNGEG